jgi:hypothetical protein
MLLAMIAPITAVTITFPAVAVAITAALPRELLDIIASVKARVRCALLRHAERTRRDLSRTCSAVAHDADQRCHRSPLHHLCCHHADRILSDGAAVNLSLFLGTEYDVHMGNGYKMNLSSVRTYC